MRKLKTKLNKERGITLIALLITIIVLLILAGVSIAMLSGENGILTQANNAKVQQSHGAVKEGVSLAYNEYQILKQTADNSKVASTDITTIQGVEANQLAETTDETVDTSNFLNFLIAKGYVTATETDGEGVINVEALTGSKQALGNGIDPNDVYKIKKEGTDYTVTYQENTEATEVIYTIASGEEIDWEELFENAKKPEEQTESSDIGFDEDGYYVDMDNWYAAEFDNGVSLHNELSSSNPTGYHGPIIDGKIVGKIPKYVKIAGTNKFLEVTSLDSTFLGCIDLEYAPKIPDSVTNMSSTFSGCTSLEQAPEIPDSVTDMWGTFSGCSNLRGYITINANPTSYDFCFKDAGNNADEPIVLRGKSNILQELANTGSGIMLADSDEYKEYLEEQEQWRKFEEWADSYLEGISDITELENLVYYPYDFTEEDREELKQWAEEDGKSYEELLKEEIKSSYWIEIEYQSYLNGWDGKSADELKPIYVETIGYDGSFSEYLTSIGKTETDLDGLRESFGFSKEQEADFLKGLLCKYIKYGDTL